MYGKKASHVTFEACISSRPFQPFWVHSTSDVFKKGRAEHFEFVTADLEKWTPSLSSQTTVLAAPPQDPMSASSCSTSAHDCPISQDSSSVSSLQYNLPFAVSADINNRIIEGRRRKIREERGGRR